MRLGIHMPQKGGFQRNVKRAGEIGCRSVQIFPGNPTSWKLPSLDPDKLKKRGEYLKEWDLTPLIIHAVYLLNLASPHQEVYEKSQIMLEETMQVARCYGAPYVVIHTGSHGSTGREKGLSRIMEALERQIPRWPPGVTLLLENTSGGGSLLGGDLRDLGEIVSRFRQAPLGVCFDTAHAWGAGYDLSEEAEVWLVLEELFSQVEISRLLLIHANDTTVERGSGKDRHQHIGQGAIGEKGFGALLNREWGEDFPVILETPEMGTEKDRENLQALRRCIKKGGGA